MTRLFSRIYRALEYIAIAISLALLSVGLVEGATWLAHMGAIVTMIGIALTFAMAPERNRMARALATLSGMSGPALDDAIRRLRPAVYAADEAEIRSRLDGELAEESRSMAERHEMGLLTGEVLLLGLGTFFWGFADLMHHVMPASWPK